VAEHLTDEEQLENLKKWWREYGTITIAVVALSVGGYFGSIFYKEKQQNEAEEASVIFQQMIEITSATPSQTLDEVEYQATEKLAAQLKNSFGDSQYSRYAALLMARLSVEKNDLDAAAEKLNWVLDDADEGLGLIVNLRLARVEASRGNIDLALSMTSDIDAKTMTSAYSEAQGDFYMLKEDRLSAYKLYLQALSQSVEHDNPHIKLLKLKLNQVTPVAAHHQDEASSGDEN